MDEPRLEITYRRGRPLAAYYYLPGPADRRSSRSVEFEPGIVVDFARGGRPLGVEIIDPTTITVRAMNRVLRKIGAEPLRRGDLGPLLAA